LAAAASALVLVLAAGETLAHAGERAYVLLLPTRLYITGGTLIVALSFFVVLWVPRRWFTDGESRRPVEPSPLDWAPRLTVAFIAVLVTAGYLGSRDPLANPLPTVVWSLWWVGVTFLHVVFGNLWASMNPLRAFRGVVALAPGSIRRRYPTWLGYWPAVGGFFAFAWFELVFPAPQDPALLAHAVVIYFAVSLCGMNVFGAQDWLRFADPFTVFFRMVSWLAPITFGRDDQGRPRVAYCWPCAQLLHVEKLPVSGVALVILVLASVSFDGLSRSFWWLDLVGENPLEYPGRTALVFTNSLGLIANFLAFTAAYTVTAWGTARLSRADTEHVFAVFILSIIPIAFGYHFAHYLPAFLVDAQYALRALSDPFVQGWNLLGTAKFHVTASFLSHHASVEIIWYLQTAAIVVAHICAVVVAHVFALRHTEDRATLVIGQLPALVLMIGYTLFGLWLLSTPIAA
jgi:hypothetical protein